MSRYFFGRGRGVVYRLIMVLIFQVVALCPGFAERYAIIVGHNKGGPSVDELHYAETDALRGSTLLKKHCGFKAENIQLLLHPDSGTLMRAGEELIGELSSSNNQESNLFFFYYSGHADVEGLLFENIRIPFSALKNLFSRIPAEIRIAVFDACQSGAVVAFKGGKRAEPFFFSTEQKSKGEIWIASSSAQERAQESESLKSSLFSFHFFNGLCGSADVSHDLRVTVSEAYQYAYKKTIETSALTTGVVQHPMYRFNLSGEGDIILSDFSDKQGGITIDKTCSGTFLIMSRNYSDVYADFFKPAQTESFIALADGNYIIINAKGSTNIGLYQFSISGAQSIVCNSEMFHASLLEKTRKKKWGGEHLK